MLHPPMADELGVRRLVPGCSIIPGGSHHPMIRAVITVLLLAGLSSGEVWIPCDICCGTGVWSLDASCPVCEGDGIVEPSCSECGGTGYVTADCPDCTDGTIVCDTCWADGSCDDATCPACDASGRIDCYCCGGEASISVTCLYCSGDGHVEEECPACLGRGVLTFPETCPGCGGAGGWRAEE